MWLENLPSLYISDIKLLADTRTLTLTVNTANSLTHTETQTQTETEADNFEQRINTPESAVSVRYAVKDGSSTILSGTFESGKATRLEIPRPVKLWEPSSPFLYGLELSVNSDTVTSYFGMRSITMVRFMVYFGVCVVNVVAVLLLFVFVF